MESVTKIWDSSDRRSTWKDWVLPSAGLADVWVSKDLNLSGVYFLEEDMRSLHLERATLSMIHFYCSRFEGGRWSHVTLESCELSDVVFRNVFLEDVNFSNCVLKNVRFEACVMKDCQFPGPDEDFAAWTQAECLWLDGNEAVPQPLATTEPTEEPEPEKTVSSDAVDSRFAGLE